MSFLDRQAIEISIAVAEGNYDKVLKRKNLIDTFIEVLIFESEKMKGLIK